MAVRRIVLVDDPMNVPENTAKEVFYPAIAEIVA